MKFNGLTDKEVEESRKLNGSNRLSEVETETFWDKLKANFGDPMIKILCVALGINVIIFILGKWVWLMLRWNGTSLSALRRR